MIGYVSRPVEIKTRKGQSRIHSCDFCSHGFDFTFFGGSVRKPGKSMLCVQFIESINYVGVEQRCE